MWTGKDLLINWFCFIAFEFVKHMSLSSRSAAVDSTGREFNRNRLIALMAAIVLEEVRLLYLAMPGLVF